MGPNESADINALVRQLEDRELHIAKCISRINQKDKQILELEGRVELLTKENTKLHEIILLYHRDSESSASPSQKSLSPQRVKASKPDISSKPSREDALQTRSLNPPVVDLRAKLSAPDQDIFQAAASLGEGMIFARYGNSKDGWKALDASVERCVGGGMGSILKKSAAATDAKLSTTLKEINSRPPIHSLLAQVTLQVFLTNVVAYEIYAWVPQPGNAELSKSLNKIYDGLQAAENHATCKHWRSLTSSQLPLATDPTQWKEMVKDALEDLFFFAFWGARDKATRENFYRALDPIYTALRDIRTSIWGISKEEYEISVVKGGVSFNPAGMYEAYGNGTRPLHSKGGDVVLGTTSLGLCKVNTGKDGFATNTVKLVVKPEVVVESSFRAVLGLGLEQPQLDGRD